MLAKQPLPQGPHLTIVTNAGGPGVLATDAAIVNDCKLTSLSSSMVQELDQILPPAWSHSNPVDILGDADPERYAKVVNLLMSDPKSDGLLVILSPQDMTEPTQVAQRIRELAKIGSKPLFASWMGGLSVSDGAALLSHAQIPVFNYPDDAARTFAAMWKYGRNLQRLYEMPLVNATLRAEEESFVLAVQAKHTRKIILDALHQGRTLLNEYESKQILEDYGIEAVTTLIAKNEEQALEFSKQIGFPLVLKLFSPTITHKSDIGGVKLNLQSPEDVVRAYREILTSVVEHVGIEHFAGVTVQQMIREKGIELILGSTSDPQFGPVILFGMGGQWVEIIKDKALAIPPLNRNLARHLMQKTKIYKALLGARGMKAVNLALLEDILINFSRLVIENPRIKECDINPLLASSEQILALDARIVLHGSDVPDDKLPHIAIRPYPYEYVVKAALRNGTTVVMRPILPEDELLVKDFHRQLSDQTVRNRYFEFMSLDARVAHDRLIRICFNDYNREWAIVVEIQKHQKKELIGIGRLMRIPGTSRAQFKLIIRDDHHHLGLGSLLLKHLISIAKEENIEAVDGYILSENQGMLSICKKLGFSFHQTKHDPIIHVERIVA